MNSHALLDARDVVKTYPGVRALDRVSFELRRGEVHALVGENGAGKSTLMHVLGGVLQPNSGTIEIDGQPIRFRNAFEAARAGISVVFQELSLAPNLSIAENVFANRQPVRRCGFIDRRRLYQGTSALLKRFDLDVDPATPVKRLSPAHQQVVEILKALSQQPKVLILDEPTSSLTAIETARLFENIRRLKAEGVSCIYISHNLPEVFAIADRVTILRDGRHVDTTKVEGLTEEDVVRKMVGRELANLYGTRAHDLGEILLRVERTGRSDAFDAVSFSVRRGEIVGLAGLVGAGRTELGRALFGVEPLDRGDVYLDDAPVSIRSPRQAIAHRIGYLTEDRRVHGLFLRMRLADNCVAPRLEQHANRWGFMRERTIARFAQEARRRFNIVTPGVGQRVGNLSGGNQQKVLLSMWVGIDPRVLIVDEPTRGVDVGAKSEIYARLRELAARGVGIIVISSDLTEVLGLCDRILVMRQGRLAGEFPISDATEERIIACASGTSMTARKQ